MWGEIINPSFYAKIGIYRMSLLLQRGEMMGKGEDGGIRIVECLRGRLLAERVASKAAKEESDLMAKREKSLLFRGKEKDNEEHLHMQGVKDMAKTILLEDPESKARKLEKMNRNEVISEACEAVVIITSEVDKLAEKANYILQELHMLVLTSAPYQKKKLCGKMFVDLYGLQQTEKMLGV